MTDTQTNSLFSSLIHGSKFNQKQHLDNKKLNFKHKDECKYREGFSNTNATTNANATTNTNVNTNPDAKLNEINALQSQYDSLLKNYNDLYKQVSDNTQKGMNRLNKNNPYLNNNIIPNNSAGELPIISSGIGGYVTSQGLFKNYADKSVFDSTAGKNGCPTNTINDVKLDNYSSTFMQGKDMISGQSCGYEGSNVYVTKLVNTPISNFMGCYTNSTTAIPTPSNSASANAVTDRKLIVPKMTNNGQNDFIASASSVLSNSDSMGAWTAFDQNPNTYWNSGAGNDWLYQSTGLYAGKNSLPVVQKNGTTGVIKGEWLVINMPGINTSKVKNATLTSYDIQGIDSNAFRTNPNTWYIIGRDDKAKKWIEIDYQKLTNYSPEMQTYTIANPKPYAAYGIIITAIGDGTSAWTKHYTKISSWNLYTSNTVTNASPSPNAVSNKPPAMTNIGNTTMDKCKAYATDNGYSFFAMQGLQSDGTAACLVGNDKQQIISYGSADNQVNFIPLWTSNTANSSYTTATITSAGQITLSTANGEIKTLNDAYQKCKNVFSKSKGYDAPGNDLVHMKNTTMDKCNTACINDDRCVGFAITDNNNECWIKSDISKRNEKSNRNLYSLSRESKDTNCVFFIMLQADGNMCLYNGKPNDTIVSIFSTNTTTKQKDKNEEWVSSKGKYGKPYLLSGQTLSTNDWIGSDDGSLKLIMQPDGNLVLYTSVKKIGCSIDAKTNMKYGSDNVNAVYKLDNTGYPNNLGNIGYIDKDAVLHKYPGSMLGYSTDYSFYDQFDSPGNDISQVKKNNMDECKTECNKNEKCGGFVWKGNADSNICYLKNSGIVSKSKRVVNQNTKMAVRKPKIISTKMPSSINEIDSIRYQNYKKGDDVNVNSNYNDPVITDKLKNDIKNVQNKLVAVAGQIASKMEEMYQYDKSLFVKMNMNDEQVKNQIMMYKTIDMRLNNYNPNSNSNSSNQDINNSNRQEGMQNLGINDINGMLLDSDLHILQENYGYIFWSILAVGLLTVTINVMKKNE